MLSAMTSEGWIIWTCLMSVWTAIPVLVNLTQSEE